MGGGQLYALRLLDMAPAQRHGAGPALVAAIAERAAQGERSLLLLNRRGCARAGLPACGWKSQCPSCSAFRVFHKLDRTLRCHHRGACPAPAPLRQP